MRTVRRVPALTAAALLAAAALVGCSTSAPEPVAVAVEEETQSEPAEPEATQSDEPETQTTPTAPESIDSVDVSALDGPVWHGLMLTDGDDVLANKTGTSVGAPFWMPGMPALSGCSWAQTALADNGEEISSAFITGMDKDSDPYLIYTAKVAASGLTADSYETRLRPFTVKGCTLGSPVVAQMDDLAASSLVGVGENVVALVDDHGDTKTVGVNVRTGAVVWEQEGRGETGSPHGIVSDLEDFVSFPATHHTDTVIVDVETGRSATVPGSPLAAPLVARFDDNAFLVAGITRTDIVYLDGNTISVGEDDWTNATAENPGDAIKGHLLSEVRQYPVLTAEGAQVFASQSARKANQGRRILYVDAQGQVASVFPDDQSDELNPEIKGSYGQFLQIEVRGSVPVTINLTGEEIPDVNPGFIAQTQRTIGGKTWVLWNSDDLNTWIVEALP